MTETAIQLPRASTEQRADVVIGRGAGLARETIIDIFRGTVLHNADAVDTCLFQIGEAVESSRRMLAWPENWDGEGARAYSPDTFNRASRFVEGMARAFVTATGKNLPAPRILPGPDGSIDIDWKVGSRELLINIPADSEELPDFYGDTGQAGAEVIKGTFDLTSSQAWLLTWLTT